VNLQIDRECKACKSIGLRVQSSRCLGSNFVNRRGPSVRTEEGVASCIGSRGTCALSQTSELDRSDVAGTQKHLVIKPGRNYSPKHRLFSQRRYTPPTADDTFVGAQQTGEPPKQTGKKANVHL
jgi:hypothetical protein